MSICKGCKHDTVATYDCLSRGVGLLDEILNDPRIASYLACANCEIIVGAKDDVCRVCGADLTKNGAKMCADVHRPKAEPPKAEPPKAEPPKAETAATTEPPKIETIATAQVCQTCTYMMVSLEQNPCNKCDRIAGGKTNEWVRRYRSSIADWGPRDETSTCRVSGSVNAPPKAEPPKVVDTECTGRGVDVEKSGTKLHLACVKCGRAVHSTNTGCPGCGADLTKTNSRIWIAAPERGTWEERHSSTKGVIEGLPNDVTPEPLGGYRFRCVIDDSVRPEHLTDEPSPGNEDGHYSGTIQPIDFIRAQGMDFEEGSVIKYVARYKKKNGLEDLKKARWYIDRLIARFEK